MFDVYILYKEKSVNVILMLLKITLVATSALFNEIVFDKFKNPNNPEIGINKIKIKKYKLNEFLNLF